MSAQQTFQQSIKNAKRVVIKISSALVVEDGKTLRVRTSWLNALASDIAKQKKEFVIVSSGAVALGRSYLGLTRAQLRLDESQAAAAAGQQRLMQLWGDSFAKHKRKVAQILLNGGDIDNRRRYLNARATIKALLQRKVIPIINENDTTTTQELRYGDNDRLSARVAAMLEADCLVLFSTIGGLYTKDPHTHKNAELVPLVQNIGTEVRKMASARVSKLGSGGMKTKLDAASIAMRAGCDMILADGRKQNALADLQKKDSQATLFHSGRMPKKARASWIVDSPSKGKITIDDGAVFALRNGKSLLPIGATEVQGTFQRGDKIDICTRKGRVIACGLSAQDSTDSKAALGKKAGLKREELVHRDDLVILAPHERKEWQS